MVNLRIRSSEKELLDDGNIPFDDIRQNMKELNAINTYLGGHQISIDGVKQILKNTTIHGAITICEIGCGGGDNLKAIDLWCNRNGIAATFIGIDLKSECIGFAQQQYPTLKAEWIADDFRSVRFKENPPDIIFSSLFCHHFTDKDIILMLQWMQANTARGFFISDLHRHWLAYYSILILTGILSRSYLVKNDAPLSVARGFTKKEWDRLIVESGVTCSIRWRWAFRFLIIYRKPTFS